MADMFTPYAEFHFLRPLWLWAIIPAILLVIALWRQRSQLSLWNRAIDRSLLPHLLDSKLGSQQSWPLVVLLLAWILSSISIAGPVWEKLPQPVQKKEDALVIIQDLSLSFYAQDLSPTRMTRAQHKLTDLLAKRKEGTTALVVYSGDAHIVAPLTDDTRTIASMVPALSPGIMPSYGSNMVDAVDMAMSLFKETAVSRGKILLLTDEVSEDDIAEVTGLLQGRNVTLSVIGVGTEDGGPIPQSDGGFWKDDKGTIIIPRMNRPLLQKLASNNRGRYSDIQLTDEDFDYLLAAEPALPSGDDFSRVEREFDQWSEQGGWLLLFIVPVALWAFRKGWVLGFVLVMIFYPNHSHAFGWDDLWQRSDQQAARALSANDPARAAELFQLPQWKGTAAYKAEKFAAAVNAFNQSENADAHYNRGNSLAKMGRLDEAIKAYEQALQLHPDMEDASFNKDLIEKLMQQQEQQSQQGEGEPSDDQHKQDGEQQKGDQQPGQDQQDQQDQQAEQQDGQQQDGQQQDGQQQDGQQQDGQQQDSAKSREEEQEKNKADQQQAQQGDEEKESGKQEEGKQLSKEDKEAEPGDDKQSLLKQDASEKLDGEEQQALEQWLRQVPDNPGGLLQRKFEYQSQQNRGRRNDAQRGKIW